MTQERRIFQPIEPKAVCQAYELLHSSGYVSFPLTPLAGAKVEAIVANITGTFFEHEMYATIEEKTVAYLYFLIKDHPFTDGNKRTAVIIFSVVAAINNLIPKFGGENPTLDELAVFIEKIQEDDHHRAIREIAQLLF